MQQQLNNHEAMFRSLAMPGLSYANAFESYAPPIHQHLSPNYFTNNGNHFIAHHGPSASDVMLARSGLDMTQNNGTPQQSSNNDYAAPKISGMTPLVFSTTAGVLANQMPAFHPNNAAAAMRNAMNAEATNNGNQHQQPMNGQYQHPHQQIMNVVSSDSQGDNNHGSTNSNHGTVFNPNGQAVIVNGVMIEGGVPGMAIPLQQPKKWVRWSEQEDQYLRRAVHTLGENSFKMISEKVFHGTRTEVQCKNRWKKVGGVVWG